MSTEQIIEAVREYGLSPGAAICRAMGFTTIGEYAEVIGRHRAEVAKCLRGEMYRVYPAIREDVAFRLKITRAQLDKLIDELCEAWRKRHE